MTGRAGFGEKTAKAWRNGRACHYIARHLEGRGPAFWALVLWVWIVPAALAAAPAVPAVIPVGADAYLRWDLWPYQRIGARTYMRSTYDRTGGNSDASHFLYQQRDDFNVTVDEIG